MLNEFKGKNILVTGGTGSIGFHIVRTLLALEPKQIRVFSRDDSKQFQARMRLNNDIRLRFLLGDVRDKDRLNMAMEGVDIVFHAAALKHVSGCENDPFEAVKTNVLGTQNVIECALKNNVEKVVGISTDKAADPTSVLGCTKLLSEKLMSAVYHYKGTKKTKFCFVRFGNVIGTRGSVVPLFCWQIKNGGPVTVTDPLMRRFFMSIDDAVQLIFKATNLMRDREIFILKMPIMRITDLAEALVELYAPKFGKEVSSIKIDQIGRLFGERMHEKLVGRDECENALETPDMFILKPFVATDDEPVSDSDYPDAHRVSAKEYSTDSPELQDRIMNKEQIKRIIQASESYIEDSMM
ncbi:MAG: polysaccharide biosynthesis protein [Patescibacteria group bacterium]|jgi:FlaA1/EpsC-like NDP-sugar epimerase